MDTTRPIDHTDIALEALVLARHERKAAYDMRLESSSRAHRAHRDDLANDALATAQVHATLALAAAQQAPPTQEASPHGGARRHTPPGAIPIANHRGAPLTGDERANYLASLRDDARYLIEGTDLRALIMGWEATVADWHEAEGNVQSARAILEEGNQWAELRDALGFPVYTALRSALGYEDQHDEAGA